MNAHSKRLLKVSSILLIIFGVIATAISTIGLIVYVMMADSLGGLPGIIIFTMILILAVSVLELIAGIVGLKKYRDPANGRFFITSGMILCVLSLVCLILSIAGGSFNITIMGIPMGTLTIVGFVLPVLFVIGGSKNKKAVPPVA